MSYTIFIMYIWFSFALPENWILCNFDSVLHHAGWGKAAAQMVPEPGPRSRVSASQTAMRVQSCVWRPAGLGFESLREGDVRQGRS